MNFNIYSIQGSSYNLPAHGRVGVRARFQNDATKIFRQSREGAAEGRGLGEEFRRALAVKIKTPRPDSA